MFTLMNDAQFNKQVAAEVPDALYEKALRMKAQGEEKSSSTVLISKGKLASL